MRSVHTILAIVVLSGIIAIRGTLATGAQATRVIDKATPYVRPDNVPAASDVTMRTLVFRTASDTEPHDTFEALDAFHATRLEWVYLRFEPGEAEKIERVKKRGRVFGGASNASSGTDVTWHEDGTATKKHVMINPDGTPVIPPHMAKWAQPQSPGCCNDPAFRQGHLDYLKRYIDAGVETMQRDEPQAPHDYAKRGQACYCSYCVAAFRELLASRFNTQQLKDMGVDDIASFDYRAYVRSEPGARGHMLAQVFTEFQTLAYAEFLAWIKQEMTDYAGRQITYSGNNTSFQKWDADHYRVFDFALSELMLSSANPAHIYERAQMARSLGKIQVFGSPKTMGKKVANLALLKRKVIATSYASGGLSRVPWDIFNQSADGKQRYFGKPEDFADLYAMVRASHDLLDKYCTAGAFGEKIKDLRYGNQPPIRLDQAHKGMHVFLRAIPGDKDAPVVVHIVDWGEKHAPTTLHLRKDAFFPGQKLQVFLRTPSAYNATAHEQAEKRAQGMRKPNERLGPAESKAYAPLILETPLNTAVEGEWTAVEVPAVTPWGILVVSAAKEGSE